MTFTQTFEGEEATGIARYGLEDHELGRLHERYNIELGCRAPFCYSSLSMVAMHTSTTVALHQTISGDQVSFTPQRQQRLQEAYCVHTGCRVPFCEATLHWVPGSIEVSVLLDIPDAHVGSAPPVNASLSTAAAVTAAATALSSQPVGTISTVLNETVVSTSSAVTRTVRRFEVELILSIPNAHAGPANTSTTVGTIMAAADVLTAQPSAVASVVNATVISTSPVVVADAIVALAVAPASRSSIVLLSGRASPVASIMLGLLALILLAIACVFFSRNTKVMLMGETHVELTGREDV